MFAPLGYTPITALWSSTRKHLMQLHVEAFIHTVLRFENDARKVERAWSLMATTGLVDSFENRIFLPSFSNNLYLASPTGQMVAFDIASAMKGTLGQTIATDGSVYAALELTQLPKSFEDQYLLSDRSSPRVERAYRNTWRKFDDRPYDRVKFLVQGLDLDQRYRRLPLFYERNHYTISFAAFDYAKEKYPDDFNIEPVLGPLRPFEGWAMCISDDVSKAEWPERITQLLSNHSSVKLLASVAHESSTIGGRPADMREAAGKAYRELYPQGHKPLSWKQAQKACSSKTGISTSISTLKRAIGNKG